MKDAIPKNVTHVKVDPSVKKIQAHAFEDCLSLVEDNFSEGLERICSCSRLSRRLVISHLRTVLLELGFNSVFRGTASDWCTCVCTLLWIEKNQDSISTHGYQYGIVKVATD
jgi:hypothetical protein